MTDASKLTPKQEAFCLEYLSNGGDASAAYRKCYDASNTKENVIHVKASQMLSNGKVSVRIKELLAPAMAKAGITVERIAAEYAKLAFLDPRKFFDEHGALIPVHKLDDDTAAALGGMDVAMERDGEDEDGKPLYSPVRKIRMIDKKGALDSLAKWRNMFVEKVEHTGSIEVSIVDYASQHKTKG